MDAPRFASLIRRMRERHGLKSFQLAAKIGKQPSYVSRLENGTAKETPPPDVLEALSRELGVSVAEMLESIGYDIDAQPTVRELPDSLTPAQREAVLSYARYLVERSPHAS